MHSSLGLVCVHVCVCHCHWQGEGARRWMLQMEENSKMRKSKVSSSGKTQNHRPSPGGSRHKKNLLEKMTGHLNHLNAVIENKCGASLTILKHNPITVL